MTKLEDGGAAVEGQTPDWPHASWDDVVAAVCDASNNAEGRTSAAYLEHHFQKAGLVVLYHVDMPEHPTQLAAENERLRKALAPFARVAADYDDLYARRVSNTPHPNGLAVTVTLGDCRDAYTAALLTHRLQTAKQE